MGSANETIAEVSVVYPSIANKGVYEGNAFFCGGFPFFKQSFIFEVISNGQYTRLI